jgi:hypothetical protein
MPQSTLPPTPHNDVNAALEDLSSSIVTALSSSFVGLYLGGSLALGDFDPKKSDIDFICVTAGDLSSEDIAALDKMHNAHWSSNNEWIKRLDGSYVPLQVVREWSSESRPYPFVEGEEFRVTIQGSALIQRYIVREYGVIVAGPNPKSFIESIDRDRLRSAQGDLLVRWWEPVLGDPGWLEQIQQQRFAVLTMCRALYTLEYGDVASKPLAGKWAKKTVEDEWTSLIDWALASAPDTDSNYLTRVLEFIEYVLQYGRRHHFSAMKG